ncbi:MAG: hypothetical protein E6H94_02305 [Chloroflexi bacterium]|nr:MAG: hypothetical protein E6H94_02305 [Chloroflexota bacterium]
MAERRVVAVVPFGARGPDGRAGIVGRQLARRLVERFADHDEVELRPVFLVALPAGGRGAEPPDGYLVFGSTPNPELAARYGASAGATHTVTGLYREDGGGRALALTLVDVATSRAVATWELPIAAGDLQLAEPAASSWLASVLGIAAPPTAAAAGNEPAYVALLDGADAEVNATLLRAGDPARAASEVARAQDAYVAALRADLSSVPAEERLLVLAAESIERGDEARSARSLEELALEHAHALHPLRDEDVIVLAELYLAGGAGSRAAAHLRAIATASPSFARAQELLGILALGKGDVESARASLERAVTAGASGSARLQLARVLIASGSSDEARRGLVAIRDGADDPAVLAQARRLLLGLDRPDLEEVLERAGRDALSSDPAALASARADFERVAAHDDALWEAHFGIGLVARQTEDGALAARELRRALDLVPDQPDALHELGVALLAAGDAGEALALLDRAAALRPKDAAYLADAGFAHLRAGDLDTARERLRLASGLDAEDPLTRAYLAELERVEAAAAKQR